MDKQVEVTFSGPDEMAEWARASKPVQNLIYRQAEEVADLRQQLDGLLDCVRGRYPHASSVGDGWDCLVTDLYSLRQQLAATIAECDRAVKDAERYRWLRDHCYQNEYNERPAPYALIRICVGEDEKYTRWMTPGHTVGVGIPSLDTAVDLATSAAIAAGGEETGS